MPPDDSAQNICEPHAGTRDPRERITENVRTVYVYAPVSDVSKQQPKRNAEARDALNTTTTAVVTVGATGPMRVVCYMCGRSAGTASIEQHHQKCRARWPNARALPFPPELPGRPMCYVPRAAGAELEVRAGAVSCFKTQFERFKYWHRDGGRPLEGRRVSTSAPTRGRSRGTRDRRSPRAL